MTFALIRVKKRCVTCTNRTFYDIVTRSENQCWLENLSYHKKNILERVPFVCTFDRYSKQCMIHLTIMGVALVS